MINEDMDVLCHQLSDFLSAQDCVMEFYELTSGTSVAVCVFLILLQLLCYIAELGSTFHR